MRERSLETAPADTPLTPPTPTMRKRRCTPTSLCPTHPAPRVARKEFWTARMRKIPSFKCNPWDFYQPFLKSGSNLSLVLCIDGMDVRRMRIFDHVTNGEEAEGRELFPLLEIQHPNFADIYETYLFRNEIFAIVEYVGFSIADLLQDSIYPLECEVAYIASQVLAGIRFIWSRGIRHPRISAQNILISPKGEVKIDHTLFPDNDEHTSADLNSLGTIILQMMDETKESLDSTLVDWSAEVVNFLEATSFATPDELSGHVFITHSWRSAEILTPLCTLAHFLISKDVSIDREARKRLR